MLWTCYAINIKILTSHVHFAMFKQKVTHAFREGGVPVKLLWHLLF